VDTSNWKGEITERRSPPKAYSAYEQWTLEYNHRVTMILSPGKLFIYLDMSDAAAAYLKIWHPALYFHYNGLCTRHISRQMPRILHLYVNSMLHQLIFLGGVKKEGR